MWKMRKEDEQQHGFSSPGTPSSFPAATPPAPVNPKTAQTQSAYLGKSVVIKGELSGSENLFIDGQVEGTIDLREHVLTVGPDGRIHAQVNAREVVVRGKLEGNVNSERVELKSTAQVVGDVVTQRIVMEDGAYLKGSVDVHKEAVKPEAKREGAAASAGSPSTKPVAEPAPAFAEASLAQKKV